MIIKLCTETDIDSLALRDVLLNDVVKVIHEEDNISLKVIAEELMYVASIITSSEPFKSEDKDITLTQNVNFDDLDDDLDDDTVAYYEKHDIFVKNSKQKNIFSKTEIATKMVEWFIRHNKIELLPNNKSNSEELLFLRESILSNTLEHVKKYKSIIGTIDDYDEEFNYSSYLIEPLLRTYVVLMDLNKMKATFDIVNEFFDILGKSDEYIECFRKNKKDRFSKDIVNMGRIYDFLLINPNYQQSKIFKKLSIDGRKSSYMIQWAGKYNRIHREKHKNTYLLNLI